MDPAYAGIVGTVTGAILTAGFGLGRELLINHGARKRKATYLSIRISCLLDRYVDGCLDVVNDAGTSYGRPSNINGCYDPTVSHPKLDFQSIDVDWQALSPKLMYKILSFPNKIEDANNQIRGISEYVADPPFYSELFEERQLQYSILGIESAALASELREEYDFPLREYGEWNPIRYMEERRDKICSQRIEKEASHKALLADPTNI